MDDKIYWIWLSEALGAGNFKFGHLLDNGLTAFEIYKMKESELKENISQNTQDIKGLLDKDLSKPQKIFEEAYKKHMQILTPADEKYPRRLLDIYAPPFVLYVWGELPKIDDEPVIAFVGSRKASDYGIFVVQRLAFDVASAGMLVVSGMAVGADAASHKGALKAGKKTIGVLGCGLDVGYPAENRNLMRLAIKNGALISEYPPGTMAYRQNFPKRNRIISGLANGVVVTEAPQRSGSLITARFATEQGRDVFAVPSDVNSFLSEGSNNLLKDGAKIVTCAEDILEEYESLYRGKIVVKEEYRRRITLGTPPEKKQEPEKTKRDLRTKNKETQSGEQEQKPLPDLSNLSQSEREIVLAIHQKSANTADEVIRETGLSVQRVNAALTMLELKGIIQRCEDRTLKISL